ncbi:MAG: porphobilinogen synthase [Candidatus Omnitrophota bacterium]|nr:porphobilinogen synthase [Candidatus Omnitrophota bacterium]
MQNRFRKLRSSKAIRELVREVRLSKDGLVQPFFLVEGKGQKQPIPSMPGIYRYSADLIVPAVERFVKAGGKSGLFFGITDKKDARASGSYDPSGVVQRGIRAIKKHFPEFVVVTDVCLCAYTDHGHCGIIHNKKIDNDKSLPVLARMAVSHAEAGADIVAPSDMMDFRVGAIREGLEKNGFHDTILLSYAVKYASSFYGPFREAAHSAPGFGDRKTYQMDFANLRESLKEASQDVAEGADIVMVKPALAYLDIVREVKNQFNVPIAAYNVSGEFAMVKAAAERGWIDEKRIVLESVTSMIRAGCDLVITYHAKDIARWIQE